MSDFRFLHAADIHLDSPLDHLRSLDEATARLVMLASRRAVENIVSTAIKQQVAALIIAGDLFDGPVRDASAALWVDSQFRKLASVGIAVVLIRGNHDALSNASRSVKWSTGVIELGAEKATTHIVDACGLAIHGQSFGARAVYENIAAAYPEAISGYFNIGMLHTSLSGSSGHDTYAPTSVDVLEGRGYDYWALGHIHLRTQKSLSSRAWIGFSGNTQGRHVRETGAKGCHLVHVRDKQITAVEFVPTDSVRWFELDVDVSNIDMLADLSEMVCGACEGLQAQHADRQLAVRVRFTGASKLHSHLAGSIARGHVADALAAKLRDIGSLWLESIKVETQAERSASPRGDLELPLGTLREIVADIHAEPAMQKQLLKSLDELGRKARGALSQTDWPLWSETGQSAEFTRLLGQAEQLLEAWVAEDETP
ncbi:MAG: DNA repair exonuclease [Pirellulaceae bacterium]|nr:DNA repair exonuclease [Pirellulaceae bacterium]